MTLHWVVLLLLLLEVGAMWLLLKLVWAGLVLLLLLEVGAMRLLLKLVWAGLVLLLLLLLLWLKERLVAELR